MKEKTLDFLRISTYYPRKALDFLLFNLYLKRKNNWHILKQFKNKPILVVGNGPSLNKTPLNEMNGKFVSIGMNKINLIFEKTNWKPDIITCVNGLIIGQNKMFFNNTDIVLVLPVKAYYIGVKPRKNVLFVKLKDQDKIEANIEKTLSTGCTVTFAALQIAAYLNAKSINIVGVDHSFKIDKGSNFDIKKLEGDDVNHFSKEYFKNQYWGVPDLDGSEKLYHISRKYFEANNIPITDYTVGGKLEIFNKGNINDLIS